VSGYRTLIAAAIALLGELLRLAGVDVDLADQEGLVNTVMIVGGIIATIWFRIRARRRVGGGALRVTRRKSPPDQNQDAPQ